jgi:CelD/BcsL family acetyltransferase involved in cellulose biosynthesis
MGRRSRSTRRKAVNGRDVQVFAPDIYAAARMGRSEAGQPLWKRLAYVAITRAEERLHWVVRNRLSKPTRRLRVDDLTVAPVALTLEAEARQRHENDPDHRGKFGYWPRDGGAFPGGRLARGAAGAAR